MSGISVNLIGDPSHFIYSQIDELLVEDLRIDINDTQKIEQAIKKIQPDIIFHLLGKRGENSLFRP